MLRLRLRRVLFMVPQCVMNFEPTRRHSATMLCLFDLCTMAILNPLPPLIDVGPRKRGCVNKKALLALRVTCKLEHISIRISRTSPSRFGLERGGPQMSTVQLDYATPF